MDFSLPRYIFIAIISFFIPIAGISQETSDHDHHEGDHDHAHQKNEISLAVGIVPLAEEEKVAAGIHLHYVRSVAFKDRLGVGIALETIIDEHKHFTVSGVIQYRIIKGFILGYGPGILLLKEEEDIEYHFAQHFEAVYEFEVGHFHLGPLFEVGLANNHVHYMVGVHFGIDF